MENQIESQSFNWFDELPVAQASVERQPTTDMFALQRAMPNNAIVVVPEPRAPDRGVPIWVLAFSAIAGASAFVLGAALLSLL